MTEGWLSHGFPMVSPKLYVTNGVLICSHHEVLKTVFLQPGHGSHGRVVFKKSEIPLTFEARCVWKWHASLTIPKLWPWNKWDKDGQGGLSSSCRALPEVGQGSAIEQQWFHGPSCRWGCRLVSVVPIGSQTGSLRWWNGHQLWQSTMASLNILQHSPLTLMDFSHLYIYLYADR